MALFSKRFSSSSSSAVVFGSVELLGITSAGNASLAAWRSDSAIVVTEAFAPDRAISSVRGRAYLGVLKCARGSGESETGISDRVVQGRAKALHEAVNAAEASNRWCMLNYD